MSQTNLHDLMLIEEIEALVVLPCVEERHEDEAFVRRPDKHETPDYWGVYVVVYDQPAENSRVFHQYQLHLIDSYDKHLANSFAQAIGRALKVPVSLAA